MMLLDVPSVRIPKTAPYFDRTPYYQTMFDIEKVIEGDFAEFGVFEGYSANVLKEWLPKGAKFYLFDSWEGLPEDFIPGYEKGVFKIEVPDFKPPFVIVKGFYKDTVAKWAKKRTRPLAMVHIDCDLYSSTIQALSGVNHLIKPGTLITFDEILECCSTPGVSVHEERALKEWAEIYERRYDWVVQSDHAQAAVVVRS